VAVMEISVTPAGIVQTKLPGRLKLHWPWAGSGVAVGGAGVAVGCGGGVGGLSVAAVAVGRGGASVAVGLAIGLGVGDAGMRDAVVVMESLPQAPSVSSRGKAMTIRKKPPGMIDYPLQNGRQSAQGRRTFVIYGAGDADSERTKTTVGSIG
jgi:hypothetical protein